MAELEHRGPFVCLQNPPKSSYFRSYQTWLLRLTLESPGSRPVTAVPQPLLIAFNSESLRIDPSVLVLKATQVILLCSCGWEPLHWTTSCAVHLCSVFQNGATQDYTYSFVNKIGRLLVQLCENHNSLRSVKYSEVKETDKIRKTLFPEMAPRVSLISSSA